MTEEKAITYWIDHLTGELSEENEKQLNTYFEKHPELKSELGDSQDLWTNLGKIPEKEPSEMMDLKFEAMLKGYMEAEKRKPSFTWINSLQSIVQRSWKVGLTSIAMGLVIGWMVFPSKNSTTEIDTLSDEIKDMKKMMFLTLLEQPRAQERIRAVNLAEEINPDDQVIEALGMTLNSDENLNVRLAAIESLQYYWESPKARGILVSSIVKQESPIVQSAIADAMVALREKNAVTELEKLLQSPEINSAIKLKLENSIQHLKSI